MKQKNYDEIHIFSQFYNISIAGSTNIAKSFIYLLRFCEDEDLTYLFKNQYVSDEDVYSLAGKLLAELYRLLPFVNNQVVPPFIIREAIKDFVINEKIEVKKDDKIYFYNLLQNISSTKNFPMKFNPFRDNESYKGKSSTVFGAGLHRCCGASLTEIWLHHLLVSYIKSGINLKSDYGLRHITYNTEFKDIKKVSYMVKPSKDEKN